MKKIILRWFSCSALLCLAVALVGVVFTGCESAEGLEGLTIDPSYVELGPGSNAVVFTVASVTNSTARDLDLPIAWSVSNPSLGNIVSSSGYTARYSGGRGGGVNTVTARNQYGDEGRATVKHMAEQYAMALAASPNPIPSSASMATVTATGGVAPYRWWVDNSDAGSIASGGSSDTVVYRSKKAGQGIVHARDANGVVGSVVITQEAGEGGLPPEG